MAALKTTMHDRRDMAIWGILFAVAATWPLFFFTYPSAQDLPNHLARAVVLLNPADPALNEHFAIQWAPVPNLAWDAFAIVVGRWLPLAWTMKVFMLLGLALTVAGVFLLNRIAAKRWTWAPFLSVPFLFNTGYAKGFLSFNFGVGLAILACAWWAALDERRWGLRLLVAMLLSTLLYYVHLVAWGIYGIFVLAQKLSEFCSKTGFWPWFRRLLRDGLQAAPPLLLTLMSTGLSGQEQPLTGQVRDFHAPFRRFIEAWRLIDTGDWWPSVLFLAIIGTLALSLLWRRQASFSGKYAVAIVLLVLLFFGLPNHIYNTHFVVWRLALAAVFLAIASSAPLTGVTASSTRPVLVVFLAATLGLSGWQALAARNFDTEHSNFSTLIHRIPEGGTLFMVHSRSDYGQMAYDRLGLFHVGAFAVLERKVMVPSLFANPAQQPIRYKEASFNQLTATGKVYSREWQKGLWEVGQTYSGFVANFDWVAIYGPDAEFDTDDLPLRKFLLVGEEGKFRLYCKARQMTDPVSGNKLTVCPDGNEP